MTAKTCCCILSLVISVSLSVETARGQVSVPLEVFASGAGRGSGDFSALRSLVGAGAVGTMTGDKYALHSGFWHGMSTVSPVGPLSSPVPNVIGLEQNFPNPFNPSTTIRYSLPRTLTVQLVVFNTLGQKVATLVQGEKEAGYYEVNFDASGLSSGVYFYQLRAPEYVQTRRLLLVR